MIGVPTATVLVSVVVNVPSSVSDTTSTWISNEPTLAVVSKSVGAYSFLTEKGKDHLLCILLVAFALILTVYQIPGKKLNGVLFLAREVGSTYSSPPISGSSGTSGQLPVPW